MFNIGIMELVLVLLVAVLVVGPKDLPKVARWLARQVKAARRIIREIKKETGWDEFSKEFRDTADDIKKTVKDADVSAEIKETGAELNRSVAEAEKAVDAAQQEISETLKA